MVDRSSLRGGDVRRVSEEEEVPDDSEGAPPLPVATLLCRETASGLELAEPEWSEVGAECSEAPSSMAACASPLRGLYSKDSSSRRVGASKASA